MNSSMPIVIVVALLVVGAVAWLYLKQRRTRELRGRFGPEYDRVVDERGGSRRAEAELDRRARRIGHLSIRPLTSVERTRYSEKWHDQQAHFVDDPEGAVGEADHLIQEIMQVRGYPVGEFDQRAADLSVDHPEVVENYRIG